MIKKITSNNNLVFLFNEIPHEQRNNSGIASGESILLSIYENDKFYFTTDINLIKYNSIKCTEEPTKLEVDLFNLLKEEKEVKYSVAIIKKYDISKYIHYIPKIKYSQTNNNDKIVIRGELTFKETVYEKEIPIVLLDEEIINLIDNYYFEYTVTNGFVGSKLNFKLDFPKQTVSRPYKVK